MNTAPVFDALGQDLRYGARVLRLNPGFAAVAILSLALGMGANTAIFELLNAVRLRTLPVEDPSRLVHVGSSRPQARRRPLQRPLSAAHQSRSGSACATAPRGSPASPPGARRQFDLADGGAVAQRRGDVGERRLLRDAGGAPRRRPPAGRRGTTAAAALAGSGGEPRLLAARAGRGSRRRRPHAAPGRPSLRDPRRDRARILRRRGRPQLRRRGAALRAAHRGGSGRERAGQAGLVVPDRSRTPGPRLDHRAARRRNWPRSPPASSRRRSRPATRRRSPRTTSPSRWPPSREGRASRACAATTRSRCGSCWP